MKNNKFLTLILGVAIFSGILCSGIVIAQGIQEGKDSSHLANSRTRERYPQAWELEKTKLEEFSKLSVSLDYSNLSIFPSDDYYLEYKLDGVCTTPTYDVSNGTFTFQEGQTQAKYSNGFHFFFNPWFSNSKREPYYVNLYVPEEQYFDLISLSNESGNIDIGNIQAKKADLHLSYGNLTLKSFKGKNLAIYAESGNLELDAITCDNLEISDEYGNVNGDTFVISNKTDIKLESGILELSKLETDTFTFSDEYGNCTIDMVTLNESEFILESGNLNLKQATLGTTYIDNQYGCVTLRLANHITDYNYDLNVEYGSAILDGERLQPADDEDVEIHYKKDNKQKDEIHINCESGNIEIKSNTLQE